jgi:hypothetical protein
MSPDSLCFVMSEAVWTMALLNGDRPKLREAPDVLLHATRRRGFSTWKALGRVWASVTHTGGRSLAGG